MRPSIVCSIFCSAFLLAASVGQAQAPSLDELARTTALTAADDYRIGKGYMDMVGWMYGTVEDPAVIAEVEATRDQVVGDLHGRAEADAVREAELERLAAALDAQRDDAGRLVAEAARHEERVRLLEADHE